MVVNAVSFLANTEVYAKPWRIYMKIAATTSSIKHTMSVMHEILNETGLETIPV